MLTRNTKIIGLAFSLAISTVIAQAQPRSQGPQVESPVVADNGEVTFRILAPNANEVSLSGGDIPGNSGGTKMTKDEDGVWEVTLGPIGPGAYRYNFNVDGVSVIDPRNPSVSESNMNVWSLVYVPGVDYMDTNDVPHGAIAEVTYHSSSLDQVRRMHVYTPPGYESGEGQFPVFYLLHGASDSDDSWSTIGRAGFIIDNLIAEDKAKPMIVVMPDGHTGPFRFGGGFNMNEFVRDFNQEIKPYIEKHYRVHTDQDNTAIAGLSMGGAQTLDIFIQNIEEFGYIGVYSSGIFGITGRGPGGNNDGPSWEEQHKDVLENEDYKDGIKLLWFAIGKDDFLIETSNATVDLFKKYNFDVENIETEGGHTWINWREYLRDFTPMLFQ